MRFLILTCGIFFTLVFGVVLLDYHVNGSVSSRAIAGSMAIAVIIALWHRYRIRLQDRERQRSETLARRARFYKLNGERGEVNYRVVSVVLIVTSCAVMLAVMALVATRLHAAEPDGIDQAIEDVTGNLYPACPLSPAEFKDLRAIGLSLALLSKSLSTNPSEMATPIREKRIGMRREIERLHSGVVDLMVVHAGAVIAATRKGGAR